MGRVHVVIGGGIAGVCCAETLQRSAPQEDEVILVSASSVLKGIGSVVRLTGHAQELEVVTRDLGAMAASNMRVIQATAIRLDVQAHELELSTGEVLRYNKLCIATGAVPKAFSPHPSVLTVRDPDSVQVLAEHMASAQHVAVVGNGAIALELVGALVGRLQVTWVVKHGHIGDALFDVDAAHFLLQELQRQSSQQQPTSGQALDPSPASPGSSAAQNAGGQHRPEQGTLKVQGHAAGPHWTRQLPNGRHAPGALPADRLKLELSATVVSVTDSVSSQQPRQPGASSAEHISHDKEGPWPLYLELSNGNVIGVDAVVSAIGVEPNTRWLQQACPPNDAGQPQLLLAEDNGILVDGSLRSVSVNDGSVFAAGDCCTIQATDLPPHFHQMRLWTQARLMGIHAAYSMLGLTEEYGSDMSLELFTHVTRFFGLPVVLLGLYNGQRLEGEPHGDVTLMSRLHHHQRCPHAEHHQDQQQTQQQKQQLEADGGSSASCSFIRLVLLRGRVQGAVLIGDIEMAGGLEDLILDQLDVSAFGPDLLDPDFEFEHMFD